MTIQVKITKLLFAEVSITDGDITESHKILICIGFLSLIVI